MSLTARELALRLAKHIGVTSLVPADPSNADPAPNTGLQQGDPEELTACINAALAELWQEAPTILCQMRLSLAVRAPQPITLTLVQGSATIVDFPQYAGWMEGCTVRIGEEEMRLLDATTLSLPYSGTTPPEGAPVAAVVYHDLLTTPPGVRRLLDPVEWNGRRIRRLPTHQSLHPSHGGERQSGNPEQCQVETRMVGTTVRVAVRLDPMPAAAGIFEAAARMVPPEITVDDLGVGVDPMVSFSLPLGWDEAVLLPLALARITTHPRFKPNDIRTEINRQAATARRLMNGSHPDRSAGSLKATFR